MRDGRLTACFDGFRPGRAVRYNFSPEEQEKYRRFVDMLAQIERGARMALAEQTVHDATTQVNRNLYRLLHSTEWAYAYTGL